MKNRDIIDTTFDRIMEKGFDVNHSPFSHKVVVMVVTAQGIIDNGGFDYFFEQEFEGNPNYQDFVNVFKEIGAVESSAAIEKAIKLNKKSGINKFKDQDSVLFDNSEQNYTKLRNYIEQNFV